MEPIEDRALEAMRCFDCRTVLIPVADGVVLCSECARADDAAEMEPVPDTLRLPRWWHEDPAGAKTT
jgi:hypothetical protein